MKTICVCLDGSDYSNTAAEYALHLAARNRAHVTAIHVLDSRWLEGPLFADLSGSIGAMPYAAEWSVFRELMEKKGQSVLDSFAAKAAAKNIASDTKLLHGHPVKTLLEQGEGSDLLLFGQQGENATQNDWLPGGTADRLIRGAKGPALITPRSFTPISSLLVAFDGTQPARHALAEAARQSKTLNTELYVLTVVDTTTRNQTGEIMEAGAEMVHQQGAEAEFILQEGRPDKIILEQAEANGCNLIVMGLAKHGWLAEHLVGSLSLHLIHHSHLPVLLIR